ncbi:MAG TPA: carboxypeptidase-like regulatory domain-containing protein [Saprospiraceae bacterium]|nr:carboxypeptidase-like regulatory domain-containing protein [Saprospiraceae bacterium]
MKKKTTSQLARVYVSLSLVFASAGALFSQQALPPPPPPDCGGFELADLWPSLRYGRIISGIITDLENKSLIGVNISISDASGMYMPYGTVSDMDGAFQLMVPVTDDDLYLTFSYVGYEKKSIKLKKVHPQLNIRLESIAYELSEVVVIGYRTTMQKSINIDYSFPSSQKEQLFVPAAACDLSVGQVYPNPFTTELHVRLEGRQAGAAQLHLFDAAGRSVLSRTEILQEGMQTVSFNLNDYRLPGGVYYLRVSDAAGEISTHPVVRVDD